LAKRLVGKEVFTLHSYVGDLFIKYGDVVLQLDQVEFIAGSGLGAMVRLMQAARSKGGDLKLSGLPPTIRAPAIGAWQTDAQVSGGN
jgi:anti-anti-sigma factor